MCGGGLLQTFKLVMSVFVLILSSFFTFTFTVFFLFCFYYKFVTFFIFIITRIVTRMCTICDCSFMYVYVFLYYIFFSFFVVLHKVMLYVLRCPCDNTILTIHSHVIVQYCISIDCFLVCIYFTHSMCIY